tara:strand:+ start:1279 stop:1482 length:204 start_codon:yes stop_codon:yes gene_type:complete
MIQRDEYQKVVSEMTKLKRVQKENEKLRHQYEMLEREKDHWKSREIKLTLEIKKLEAELKLWMGTGV